MARTIKARRRSKRSDELANEARFSPAEAVKVPDRTFCDLHFSPSDLCSFMHGPIELKIIASYPALKVVD